MLLDKIYTLHTRYFTLLMTQLLAAYLTAEDDKLFIQLFVSLHKSNLLTADIFIKVGFSALLVNWIQSHFHSKSFRYKIVSIQSRFDTETFRYKSFQFKLTQSRS